MDRAGGLCGGRDRLLTCSLLAIFIGLIRLIDRTHMTNCHRKIDVTNTDLTLRNTVTTVDGSDATRRISIVHSPRKNLVA